jgi:hypothetical protein
VSTRRVGGHRPLPCLVASKGMFVAHAAHPAAACPCHSPRRSLHTGHANPRLDQDQDPDQDRGHFIRVGACVLGGVGNDPILRQ